MTGVPPIDIAQAGLSAVPAVMQLISAIKQDAERKKLEKAIRPQYNIPGQVTDATGLARMAYQDPRLPGQTLMEEQLKASTASGINQARNTSSSASDVLGAIAGLNKNQGQQLNQIGIQAAQNQNQDLSRLMGALGNEAQYAEKAWDTNKFQPYANAQAAAGALRQSASQNAFNAIKSMTGIANATDWSKIWGNKGGSGGGSMGSGASSLLPKSDQNAITNQFSDMDNVVNAMYNSAGQDNTTGTPPMFGANVEPSYNPSATDNTSFGTPLNPSVSPDWLNLGVGGVGTDVNANPNFLASNMASATPTLEVGQYDNPVANRAMLADLFKNQSLTLPATNTPTTPSNPYAYLLDDSRYPSPIQQPKTSGAMDIATLLKLFSGQ